MASAGLTPVSHPHAECFCGAHHGHVALGEAADGPFDLGVPALGPMMKEGHLTRSRQVAEAYRVFGCRMPERTFRFHFLGAEVGVMDQEIDVLRQPERSFVVLANTTGAGTERRRAMVRDVGDGGASVADPESDRSPTLVRYVEGEYLEPLDREHLAWKEAEAPAAAEGGGCDRKEGRRHHAGQQCLGVAAVVLGRQQQVNPRVVTITGPEEGQPLDVIPVQMGQEDGAVERLVAEEPAQSPDPRAGIEQEGRRMRATGVVEGQRDAGRVTAEPGVVETRCGC